MGYAIPPWLDLALAPGESIRWTGQPDLPGAVRRARKQATAPCVLAILGLLFLVSMVKLRGSLWAIVFLCTGWCLKRAYLSNRDGILDEFYVITDRRIVECRRAEAELLLISVPKENIASVSCVKRTDGTGDLHVSYNRPVTVNDVSRHGTVWVGVSQPSMVQALVLDGRRSVEVERQ